MTLIIGEFSNECQNEPMTLIIGEFCYKYQNEPMALSISFSFN